MTMLAMLTLQGYKHLKRRRTAAFDTLEEIRESYSKGPQAPREGGRRSGAAAGVRCRRRRSRKNVKHGMQTDEGFTPMVPQNSNWYKMYCCDLPNEEDQPAFYETFTRYPRFHDDDANVARICA